MQLDAIYLGLEVVPMSLLLAHVRTMYTGIWTLWEARALKGLRPATVGVASKLALYNNTCIYIHIGIQYVYIYTHTHMYTPFS